MNKTYKKTRLLYGVATNDHPGITNPTVDGVVNFCPYYIVWCSMLLRVYDKKYHIKKPNYKDVKVCAAWLKFSNFKSWMMKEDWQGKALDKDIVKPGNKLYAPKTCVFVPQHINSLLMRFQSKNGLPQGVGQHGPKGRYRARIYVQGKSVFLGHFTNPEEAAAAYRAAKADHVLTLAEQQTDPRIKAGLKRHAKLIKKGD